MARWLVLLLTAPALLAVVPQSIPLTPLAFEPNAGQSDPQVKFLAHTPHAMLWLTEREAVYGRLRISFEGGASHPALAAEEKTAGISNYFNGTDRRNWFTNIPQYARVRYRSVYPGIDLVFYGNPSRLEYDFVLQPGADPSRIRLKFDGVDSMRIDEQGNLVLASGGEEIRNLAPAVLQNGNRIAGRWTMLDEHHAGFELGSYNRAQPVTIDPVLTYATYLGASQDVEIDGLAMDSQGNIIVAGATDSPDFPITAGAAYPSFPAAGLSTKTSGPIYPYITKINPSASGVNSVVFSTFFNTGFQAKPPAGPSVNGANVAGVAVDGAGNVYLAGYAYYGLPLVNQVQQFANNNLDCSYNDRKTGQQVAGVACPDAYVAEFSPAGNQLLFSTYLGGSEIDALNGIAVSPSGNIYLAGYTNSPNFPTAGNALPFVKPSLQNGQAAWVAEISASRSLVYSTYFGAASASSNLTVYGLAADANGLIYLTGYTNTSGLPVTEGAIQSTFPPAAGFSAYVAILNPSIAAPQSPVTYCTYLGGNAGTEGDAVAADSSGNIYIAGDTQATNYPLTAGTISPAGGGLYTHPFVTKLNPSATGAAQLAYSTMLRGSKPEVPNAVTVDSQGRIWVSGTTDSPDFPVTTNAFQPIAAGPFNADGSLTNSLGFLAEIKPSLFASESLVYSTFLGGTGGIRVLQLAIDSAGQTVAVGGNTTAGDNPVSPSAFQPAYSGNQDAWLARFDMTQTGPLMTSLINGASLGADTRGSLSPGMIFTIKGTGLGPVAPAFGQFDSDGRVSSNVAGVQVSVGGYACPLLYISATQINAIAPYEIAHLIGSYASFQVIYNGVIGNLGYTQVTATGPGIFSFDDGTGQAAVLNQDNSVNGANNAAARGTIIQIFGTGEGQTIPPGVDGAIANEPVGGIPVPAASNLAVTIGGIAASNIAYAGTLPGGVAGAFQIDATVPANAPTGSAVPIAFSIGGLSSQKGLTIAVK